MKPQNSDFNPLLKIPTIANLAHVSDVVSVLRFTQVTKPIISSILAVQDSNRCAIFPLGLMSYIFFSTDHIILCNTEIIGLLEISIYWLLIGY